MDAQYLFVPGPFPAANELLAARAKRSRVTDWNEYNEIKRSLQERVVYCARKCRLAPFHSAYFTYLISEENRRRDPSNLAFAAIKIIEDGLQKGGYIRNDGWNTVLGIQPHWHVVQREPGVSVFLSEHGTFDKATTINQDEMIRCRSKTTSY